MSDSELLAGYVDAWWASVQDFLALLDELGPDDWSRPTDLAGWDVKAVVSHTAHLESLLAAYARRVIDEVERLAPQDPAFRDALSNVWQRGMPDDVWIRVLAASGRENEN